MPREIRPGVFNAVFQRIATELNSRSRLALTPIALAIEKQAKINLSGDSHRRGTPTPAQHGSGPAIISGTLRRSVTHTPVTAASYGWMCQVGLAAGFYPPYGGANRTASSQYGRILELELDYPFMEPAFRFGTDIVAPQIYRQMYGSNWRQLL